SLQGQRAHDAKQLAEGVQAFEAALGLEPTDYWSMMRLGYCLCDRGQGPEDFLGAVRVFTGCILKRHDHAHAYNLRANSDAKLGQYDKPAADYSQAIKLDPTHTGAWCGRSTAYRMLSRYEEAVADASRAIELEPKDALAWCNRGLAHNSLG